jgi:hypothetical protein
MAGGTLRVAEVVVGSNSPSWPGGVGTFNMSGGTLTGSSLEIADGSSTGTVNISGNAVVNLDGLGVGAGRPFPGYSGIPPGDGNGILRISGGTVWVGWSTCVGGYTTQPMTESSDATGLLDISGGSLTCGNGLSIGCTGPTGSGEGVVTLRGGALSVAGLLAIGSTGRGTFRQTGGTLSARSASIGYSIGYYDSGSAGWYELSDGSAAFEELDFGTLGTGVLVPDRGYTHDRARRNQRSVPKRWLPDFAVRRHHRRKRELDIPARHDPGRHPRRHHVR